MSEDQFSSEAIDNAITRMDYDTSAKAVTAIDQNPDDGAEALRLSQATGVPAGVIYGDLDGFKTQHRSSLIGEILRNNDQLAEYIRRNDLADVVSNDDYGNLAKFSQTAATYHQLYQRFSPLAGLVHGTWEAARDAAMSPVTPEELESTEGKPLARAGLEAIHIPTRAMGVLAAPIAGVEEAVRRVGKLTGNESEGDQLSRDIAGIFESEMGRMGEHPHPAEPWVRTGLEPPKGLSPEIDANRAKLNSQALDILDENLADAVAVTTRERSAELFQKFTEQHYGNATIALSGDRAVELYGDGRTPAPDDGLLGWVPDLEQKLDAARTVGEDVHIPLADWMAKVDPALAKELRPDLRVWPGGITEREALEPVEPRVTVDSPMAQVRGAMGTEPMFAIGDRKLELKQVPSLEGFEEFHEYQFHDENGRPVGEITIVPDPAKKQLYVANITGLAGLYSNSFGPSLVRDLKRQLKAIYPDYETITGHRVSGAREAAGVWEDADKAHPVVKLSAPEGWGEVEPTEESIAFKLLLENVAAESFGYQVAARRILPELLTPELSRLGDIVTEEINKITGSTARTVLVGDITYPGMVRNPSGVSMGPQGLGASRILIDLFGPNALGVARHETIHHLVREKFFTPEEWNALVNASKEENWRGRYGIEERYSHLPELKQHEEAIAEAFRDWADKKDSIPQPDTLVTRAFQKLWDLWEAVKSRLAQVLGHEPSFEEIFGKVLSGEVGKREGFTGDWLVDEKTQLPGRPMFSIPPEDIKAKMDALRAEAAGLDAKSYKKLQGLIQERYAQDLAAAQARAERNQRIVQSKEWKEAARDIEKKVRENIHLRPDIIADRLIGGGELAGKKLRQRYPLRSEDLTEEQKRALPREYYSKEGMPAEAAANLSGFTSSDEMIQALVEYHSTRGELTPKEHFEKTVADEVNRQMERLYGKLDENIIRDAQDQALSETDLNILAEEWQGAAMMAGVQVVDKDLAKAEALRVFSGMKLSEIDFGKITAQMLKHARDSERLLIAGDAAGAVVRMQRRYMLGLMAAEAKKLEKARGVFDRTAKQFAKREVPNVDPEYTNFIQDILMRVGKPVRRSVQDLARQIEAGESKSLEEFVQNKTAALREVPVWDQLFDENWRKDLEQLTVEEFRAVSDSIKALVHNGRDEMKIYRQGEAADYATVRAELIQNIARSVRDRVLPPRKRGLIKSYFVNHLQMENIFNRWDGFNPKGTWNQYVFRDLVDSDNRKEALEKEFGKRLKEIKTPERLSQSLPTIFKDKDTGTDIPVTRKNLLAVMLNTGTGNGKKSNLYKLADGYKLTPDDVMAWVHQHATADDWRFVREVWDLFEDLKGRADKTYRSLTGGVAPETLATYPIQTPHGEIKGGYFPVIYHPEMEGKSRKLMGRDPLAEQGFENTLPAAGYTKSRTGYTAPMSLELDMIPNRIAQEIRDIEMRPALINASKVFYDSEVRSAVRRHYGTEYRDMMIPYLQAVANSSNMMTQAQAAMTKASEFIRQNVITTLVGLNPGTVMKHGPSALVTSMREVGMGDFLRAVKSLHMINPRTGDTNWGFAIKNSFELQRRDRNWQETLYGGAHTLTTPGEKFTPWRQKIMEWASKPVALSDMLSAVPTWLAAYEKEMRESGVHGDAVYAADRAVRRAHGSTATTSRTGIMRDANPWLTSVYNFFSDIMNRQMETLWKAGEAWNLVKEGNKSAAMGMVPGMVAGLFAYAVWPAIVEHMVSGEGTEKEEPWAKTAGKAMIRSAASSWVGVRDFVNWMLTGYDPQLGMAGTAMKELGSVWKDLEKDHPFKKQHFGRLIQDGAGFVGSATGMLPQQVGRSGRFLYDVKTGQEHPRSPWAWLTGLRFGTTKGHSTTWENYMKGKNR